MAKKFGKVLLFTAAVGSAAAAVCYFLRKKDHSQDGEEEDYDNFCNDSDESSDSSRNYVSLNPDASDAHDSSSEEEGPADCNDSKEGFTPLTEQIAQSAENTEGTIFFDEAEEAPAGEPPVSDN